MQAMLASSFDALEGAIEHADVDRFGAALEQTIETCNACHVATGSAFESFLATYPESELAGVQMGLARQFGMNDFAEYQESLDKAAAFFQLLDTDYQALGL